MQDCRSYRIPSRSAFALSQPSQSPLASVSIRLRKSAPSRITRTVNADNLQPLRTPPSCLAVYPLLRLASRQTSVRDDVRTRSVLRRSASQLSRRISQRRASTHVNLPPFAVIICCNCRFDSFGPVEPLMYMTHPDKMLVRFIQLSLQLCPCQNRSPALAPALPSSHSVLPSTSRRPRCHLLCSTAGVLSRRRRNDRF